MIAGDLKDGAQDAGDANAIVIFEGVYRTYPGLYSVTALKPCDLRVNRGDYVAIMGPSGSGKSTLLNLIGLLDSASGGRYLLAGQDVSNLRDDERAHLRGREVGFVFQSFHLLPYRTARENVEMAMIYAGRPRRERRMRSADALKHVGLEDRIDAMPPTLSGGERQRVAIARALVTSPRVVLCDEPTGNLDSASSASILDLLEDLNSGGVTVLVVTHDPNVAGRATRLVSIVDGILTEDLGSPTAREDL